MNIAWLIFGLLAGGYLMQFVFPDENEQRPIDPKLVIWRWSLLCAFTALTTVLCIQLLCMRPGAIVNFFADLHPGWMLGSVQAESFLGSVCVATTVFLLFASPFFFRRLRPLGVVAWVVSVFAAFSMLLPTF